MFETIELSGDTRTPGGRVRGDLASVKPFARQEGIVIGKRVDPALVPQSCVDDGKRNSNCSGTLIE